MKHRIQGRKLNRTTSHRKALLRNLAQSLIQHGQVRTTIAKAKELRPYAERLITLARRAREGDLVARRQIHKILSDRSFIPADRQSDYDDLHLAKRHKTLRARSGRRYRTGQPKGKLSFTGTSVSHKLINELGEEFSDRPGGYTRVIKLAKRRIGDGGQLAVVQLIGEEEEPGSVTRPGESARKRRADARYALAVKLTKQRRAGAEKVGDEQAEASTAVAEAPAPEENTEDKAEE
jgi:large subunit ribosomal protein L17